MAGPNKEKLMGFHLTENASCRFLLFVAGLVAPMN